MLPLFDGELHCSMSPPSVRGTGVVMVPPFSGGLHCGAHTLIVSPVGPFECPRRSTNGELYSGAKAYGVISAPTRMIPPFSGGLHCGPPNSQTCCRNLLGAPAV